MTKKCLTIGVAGFGRTGKDTVADLIKEMAREDVKIKVRKFADALREQCRSIGEEIGVDPWTEDPIDKEKIRPYLIELGAKKREEDPLYWVHALEKKIATEKPADILIIPDVRYQNEAEWLLARGAVILLLHRTGKGPVSAEEQLHTTRLYAQTNPLNYRKNFRQYWWTHELEAKTSIPLAAKKEREKKNLCESLPELAPFTNMASKALTLDMGYMNYLNHHGLEVPAGLLRVS